MLKRYIIWIGSVFLAALILFSTEAYFTQKSIADKTIRLHVVANSDDTKDQEQKLRLRDHLLGELRDLTSECADFEEAEAKLRTALPMIEQSAGKFLINEGSEYDISVSLCKEQFSTREYDTFSLPAGEYHALRVVIGEGKGENWWCVVFPTLCNATTMEELDRAAEKGGYDEEEIALIKQETKGYVLRFKVLEWLKGVFD